MNQKSIKTLEFHKIIEKLAAKASSPMGQELCRSLTPSTDIEEIRILQRQTADGLARLFRKGNLSFGSVKDIRPSLMRLGVGSSLNQIELLSMASLLENTARVKAYGRHDNNDTSTDCLDPMFDRLEPLTNLSAEIRRCVPSEDEISDDASPGLRQVRRSIKRSGDRIHSQLNSMINTSCRTYLQDNVITMRNGRYCIPVKAEHKAAVPGMIHDQSSTGSTVFIEPVSIVKLNNEIRELEIQEEKEIEAVLSILSAQAAEHIDILKCDLENMVQLDFIFARSALAMEMNATEPMFNEHGIFHLRQARHPLIDKKKVVPIDLYLGEKFTSLIVTGPNTGGKTVSLKTTGLLSLMGQAGLHIPALDRSELSVCTDIYADIGDEQSIEQSLSTFSSHMTNVVSFLEKTDCRSLVLFDELCAGTDPTEGAALAIAILSYLHKRGVRTMATTHYSELKLYALSTEGVENACCEFDMATLRPTYRLLIGVPGKSNAFAISARLGLPDYIIDAAKEQISSEDESFEDVLSNLEHQRIALETKSREVEQARMESEALKRQLEDRQTKLDHQRDNIIRKANEEAHAILRDAKEFADQTMRDFQKFGKSSVNAKEMEKRRSELREKVNKTGSKISLQPSENPKSKLKPSDVSIGDAVKVLSMNLKGTVSTKPDSKGNLFVQMGIIRSKVNISDLVLIDEPVITGSNFSRTGTGRIKMEKSFAARTEINLLGKRVDEAIAELDKFLDDAYLAHLPSVRIVHGKGTGALRNGIHQYLRSHPHVTAFHLAEFGEGDAGVTIAEFH